MGRHTQELVHIFESEKKKKLCDPSGQRISNTVYVSLFRQLSTKQYVVARSVYCSSKHKKPCRECEALLAVCHRVLKFGYAKLSDCFKSSFPNQTYKADLARQRLLQMPLVCIRYGDVGATAWYLVEYNPGIDYLRFAQFLHAFVSNLCPKRQPAMDKRQVKSLLQLAQSSRERELIRYAVYKSSGVTQSTARKVYGFENMLQREKRIEECIAEAQSIHEAIDQLARTQDQAVLLACGIQLLSESDTEDETYDDSVSMDQDNPPTEWAHADVPGGELSVPPSHLPRGKQSVPPSHSSGGEQSVTQDHSPGGEQSVTQDHSPGGEQSVTQDHSPGGEQSVTQDHLLGGEGSMAVRNFPELCDVKDVLKQSHYNWFHVIDTLESLTYLQYDTSSDLRQYADEVYEKIVSRTLPPSDLALLKQSYAAFNASKDDLETERDVRILNGDIVTDSESDCGEGYANLSSLASPEALQLITKKRKFLTRKVQRLKAKAIAERNFLGYRRTKPRKTIVDQYPDIGKTIETFVEESNIGADSWRRTGVLTFDGNMRVRKKVTYSHIKKHLEETYRRKFSYGTTVQLCIARNKRRRAAQNYRGVARVTSRRARKGFELKYNPDRHWSCALYRGLSFIQYQDGSNITNINRDDAAGFRLDTLTTHGKHATPVVRGKVS